MDRCEQFDETTNTAPKCPVCLDIYKTPKILPTCLHTFCEECIDSHIVKLVEKGELNDKIYCPLCKLPSPAPSQYNVPCYDWAKMLPTNVTMLTISDNLPEEKPDEHTCDSCMDTDNPGEAINYCTQCKVYQCEGCYSRHQMLKQLKSHNIIGIGEASSKINREKTSFCPEHPDEMFRYFCEEHKTPLCSTCVIEMHRQCSDISEVSELGYKLRRSTNLTNLRDSLHLLKTEMKDTLFALCDNVNEIEKDSQKLLKRMKQIREKVLELIDMLYNDIIHQTDQVKGEIRVKISNWKLMCNSLLAAIESSTIILDAVEATGSDGELFTTYHTLAEQLKRYSTSVAELKSIITHAKLQLDLDKGIEDIIKKDMLMGNVSVLPDTHRLALSVQRHIDHAKIDNDKALIMSATNGATCATLSPTYVVDIVEANGAGCTTSPKIDGDNKKTLAALETQSDGTVNNIDLIDNNTKSSAGDTKGEEVDVDMLQPNIHDTTSTRTTTNQPSGYNAPTRDFNSTNVSEDDTPTVTESMDEPNETHSLINDTITNTSESSPRGNKHTTNIQSSETGSLTEPKQLCGKPPLTHSKSFGAPAERNISFESGQFSAPSSLSWIGYPIPHNRGYESPTRRWMECEGTYDWLKEHPVMVVAEGQQYSAKTPPQPIPVPAPNSSDGDIKRALGMHNAFRWNTR